jgi:hypothetical protein
MRYDEIRSNFLWDYIWLESISLLMYLKLVLIHVRCRSEIKFEDDEFEVEADWERLRDMIDWKFNTKRIKRETKSRYVNAQLALYWKK